jgi:hypothetical protein
MVIAITILSVVVVVMAIALTAAILHILKIQKELQDIAKIEEEQDKALHNAGLYLRDLALAIKDIQDYLVEQQNVNQKKMINPFGGPIGEA